MPIPDEATVRQVLAKDGRDLRIRACIERSWANVKEKYQDRPRWRRKSTTRALMWENSVEAVAAEFDEDDGIKPVGHVDTISFVVDDIILFRLKKAASTLLSANYPTLLAELFHAHREDLFGHQGHQRVEVVHVFNRFQTELEWIGVVARDKDRILWKYELPDSAAGTGVVPLPSPTPRPAADTVLRPAAVSGEKKTNEAEK